MSLVALYALAHSWDSVSTVINQAISNPDGGGELERLIRANPAQARLTLTMAASEVNSFIAQSDGNTSSDALNADVLVVPCVADGTPCPAPPNNTNALVERNYLNGSDFLGDGEEVSFSTSGTQNWSIDRLLRADMQLQQRGYVFVGYHGTTIEAARSIVFGGIRARTQALDNRWSGFYISTYPAVAYGYALDQEPDANNRIRNGIMLRVYVPKASLQKFYSTDQTLAAPDAIGNVEQLIGHPLPLQFDSITGAEDHDDVVRVETILGWQLAEQAVAIPSTIPTDPTNVGGDLDPSTIPAQEQEISPLPDYVTTSHHDEL